MTEYEVNGVKTPQDEGTGVSEAAAGWNSAAYIGNLSFFGLGEGFVRYVGDFTVNTNDFLTMGPSQFVVINDEDVTGQDLSGEHNIPVESGMAYLITLDESDTLYELSDGENPVHIAVVPFEDEGVYIADEEPSGTFYSSFKFATIHYNADEQTITNVEYHNDQSNIAVDRGEFAELTFDEGVRTTEPSDPSDVVRQQDTKAEVIASGSESFDATIDPTVNMATGVRLCASSVHVDENDVFVAGGYNDAGQIDGVTQTYDPVEDSWTVRDPMDNNFTARAGHAAGATSTGIVVVGGGEEPDGSLPSNILGYNFSSDNWYSGDGNLNTPRTKTSGTGYGQSCYITGGEDNNGSLLSSVERIGTIGDEVYQDIPDMNEPRSNHASVMWRDWLYVFGGTSDGFNSVERINLELDNPEWEIVSGPGGFRRDLRAVEIADFIYIIGGYNTVDNEYQTDIIGYNPETENIFTSFEIPTGTREHFAEAPLQNDADFTFGGGETPGISATDSAWNVTPRDISTVHTAERPGVATLNSTDNLSVLRNKTRGYEVSQNDSLIVESGDEIGYAAEDNDAVVMLNL